MSTKENTSKAEPITLNDKQKSFTDGEVLLQVTGRALNNGYEWGNQKACIEHKEAKSTRSIADWKYDICFSHEFAKAFWGEDIVDSTYGFTEKEITQRRKDGMHYPLDFQPDRLALRWGYHLQQMVLEENPIDYLRKFIES